MKTHTSQFKEKIKEFGRELDSKITYTSNNTEIELGSEDLNSVSVHYEGAVLKSVMKQLDIDSNVEIPLGTILTYQFGVKTGEQYEYINYGNFVVYNVEKQEDLRSYKITCYDKMLYAMKDYETPVGKNLLISNNNTQTISGITFTKNTDGSIKINNTATAQAVYRVNVAGSEFSLPSGTYTISLGTNLPAGVTFYGWQSTASNFVTISSGNNKATFTSTGFTNIRFQFVIANGTAVSNVTFYPQLEKGNQATSFEPFFQYPTTVKNYLSAMCYDLGLELKDDNFANYDKQITSELFLDTDKRSMGYTFRTVFDQIAEVAGGTICINDNDKVEVRYLNYATNNKTISLRASGGTAQGISCIASQNSNIITINGQYTDQHEGDTVSLGVQLVEPMEIKNEVIVSFNNAIATDKIKVRLGYDGSNSNYFDLDEVNKKIKVQVVSEKLKTIQFLFISPTPTFSNFKITLQVDEIDEIDEEYLKDINVNFGEKYGPVNTLVLSRAGDSDKISLSIPDNLPDDEKIAIQISENQIMNGNNRDEYMPAILNKLYGLEYYINDFSSTGVCYLDLCDIYRVKVDNISYKCVMFNDEINITQGLEELIHTEKLDEAEQQYQYMNSTDRGITQANVIAKKNEATVTAYTQKVDETNSRLDSVEAKQTATDLSISILSTNIDPQTGEVNAVTTKENRFTFNDSGLNISSSDNTFVSRITNEGVFFEDGNSRVAEYTKDGSKQKDLQLFGVYYYGMANINDTPMFVAQLYTDENYDECVGHFYNGGDY